MATPQQLLTQAKGQIKQAATSPNTQGTRGLPSQGGVAARQMQKQGGQVPPQVGRQTPPNLSGFKKDGGTSAGSFGELQTLSGREPNLGPTKAMVEPGAQSPLQAKLAGLPPQIQEAIKNRGLETVMANRAGLAGRLGMPGAPPAAPGPGGPDQAVSDAAAATLGVPAPTARPLPPGAEPGGAPGLQVQSFPGFKPGGGMANAQAVAQAARGLQQETNTRPGVLGGGLTARPMPSTIPTDGPLPAPFGLGQTISDPADQMGGFEGLGRVGAGLRRPTARPGALGDLAQAY